VQVLQSEVEVLRANIQELREENSSLQVRVGGREGGRPGGRPTLLCPVDKQSLLIF
jgi:prefoldin subunit 5